VRLLIVDDDAVFREELATLLVDWGHYVEAASSGAKAIERLEATEFDAVFSDVRMPRMNGIELLRQIRERWPRVLVVMITGYATVETAVESMKLGAFDYLRKPFRSEQVERIVHLLEEERGFGGLPESNHDPARLAEQWARRGQHEVLLLGLVPRRPLPGVTAAELPSAESGQTLQSVVRSFLESHAHPALILAGVERLFAAHRTDDAVKVLGEIVDEAKGLGPVAIGFDPRGVSDVAVSNLRAVMASTRVHDTLGALANPLRRLILRRLDEGPTSFTEVMRAAGIDDSPKLSFHLRTLQEGGLVSHGTDNYELTTAGEEAIRVLKEVDEIGSAEGARAFLFPVAPPPAATVRGARKAS